VLRSINGELFQAYVDQVLVLELRPGDIAVMGNLGSHKGAGVRIAIEAAGASPRYFPPYSPDFNPIENTFQAEGRPPHGSRAHSRRPLGCHRPHYRDLHARRMHQLLRRRYDAD